MTLLARSLGASLCRQAGASSSTASSRIAAVAAARNSALPRRQTAAFSTTCAALANTLLFLEHKEGKINAGSLVAATAASKLGGDVDGLVVGNKDVDAVVDAATK